MSVKLAVLTGLLILALTASEASAFAWGGGRSGDGGFTSGSQQVRTANSKTGVPEPSSLFAVSTAMALLGGAGWLLRRK